MENTNELFNNHKDSKSTNGLFYFFIFIFVVMAIFAIAYIFILTPIQSGWSQMILLGDEINKTI